MAACDCGVRAVDVPRPADGAARSMLPLLEEAGWSKLPLLEDLLEEARRSRLPLLENDATGAGPVGIPESLTCDARDAREPLPLRRAIRPFRATKQSTDAAS